MSQLLVDKHKVFLKRCLNIFPEAYEQLDTSRLTLLFFAVSGLDIIDALKDMDESKRQTIVDWIYSLQITLKIGDNPESCGFRGTFTNAVASGAKLHRYDTGHLAMTYTGIACLLILGDDLAKVDRFGVLKSVSACQLEDGSFCAHPGGSENDMRFVYCAVSVCSMLNDFRPINIQKLIEFIFRSLNYDGGFGQGPGFESHGGSTFCAVASLYLLGLLDDKKILSPSKRARLLHWCVCRQNQGFHGRPNKPDDSCYTFWIGSTLHLLNALHLVDCESIREFTLSTQDELVGGFGKYPDSQPDALHTYLSLAGLSVLSMDSDSLEKLHPALNISHKAACRLEKLGQQVRMEPDATSDISNPR